MRLVTGSCLVFAVFAVVLLHAPSGLFAQVPTSNVDSDLDGWQDAADPCPRIPNPAGPAGRPITVCGAALRDALHRYVFMQSRTFEPTDGIDPGIEYSGRPLHLLLHLHPGDGPDVLPDAAREALARLDVSLWDYLAHHTYHATVPGDPAALEALVGLAFVRGVTALTPVDRMDRAIRKLRGSSNGRTRGAWQSFAVTFYPDVPPRRIKRVLQQVRARPERVDGNDIIVRVKRFELVERLAGFDEVMWIEDSPGDDEDRGLADFESTTFDIADDVLGLRGTGLTVAMQESTLAGPVDHPSVVGRITQESAAKEGHHALGVAGILIGDGSLDPTARGYLPESQLVSYSVKQFPATRKLQGFGLSKRAREDHDAVLMNVSWGPTNCNKVGAYSTLGKWMDKSVTENQILMVYAAGNTRGPEGKFTEVGLLKGGPCEHDLSSLPHPVPKNDISVGNWEMDDSRLHETSAAGPAADERLKPDLVAPGEGVPTIFVDEETGQFINGPASGTSASAPVVSGIAAQILQVMRDEATVSRDPLTVPPETVKAILLHTAKDVGPPGPDYYHGYGLIQAAPAARIARDHDVFVWEGSVSATGGPVTRTFDILGPVFSYKVTLVWSDKHGTHSSTMALIDDLDLTVTAPAPSNQVFRPFDTLLLSTDPVDRRQEALAGARRCDVAACQDRVNNVEQVVVSDGGTALTPGTWTVTVDPHRLPSGTRAFTVVLSPECPLRISDDLSLGAAISCPYEPLEPVAISIESDDVTLNCGNNLVLGAGHDVDGHRGRYTGIRSNRDGVTIRNCRVSNFDVGIRLDGGRDATLEGNTVDVAGSLGIDALGESHAIRDNTVQGIQIGNGVGIESAGTRQLVAGNHVDPSTGTGVAATGIRVTAPPISRSDLALVVANQVVTATAGIEILATDGSALFDAQVIANNVSSVTGDGIVVGGRVQNTLVEQNHIEGFGPENAGIHVKAMDADQPTSIDVELNTVIGTGMDEQSGIHLEGTLGSHVSGNLRIESVGIGIVDEASLESTIELNITEASVVGIDIVDSDAGLGPGGGLSPHVQDNTVRGSGIGVRLGGATRASVRRNVLSDVVGGVYAEEVEGPGVSEILDNRIDARGTGIDLDRSADIDVIANNIETPARGIVVTSTDSAYLYGNIIGTPRQCIVMTATTGATVTRNILQGCTEDGVTLFADTDGLVSLNTFRDISGTGISYNSGSGGRILSNIFEGTVGSRGISLGDMDRPTPLWTWAENVEVSGHTLENFSSGIYLGGNLSAATITDNDIDVTGDALYGIGYRPKLGDTLTIERNEFRAGGDLAAFRIPVDTLNNDWGDVPTLDIVDSDGDGFGDCGSDHIYSSTDYRGTLAGVAKTSTRTKMISDAAPVTTNQGTCP